MTFYPKKPDPWTEQAICATHENPDLWFSDQRDEIWEAMRICGECPVQARCALEGLREPFGVYGGVPDIEQGIKVGVDGRSTVSPGSDTRRLLKALSESGLSHAELAARFNLTPDAVAQRLQRIRRAAA